MKRTGVDLFIVAALCLLSGCAACGIPTSRSAAETATLLFGRTNWFQRPGGMQFQAGMLITSLFAKVPLVAFISIDSLNRLEFVGLSDWGMPLAQASVTVDDPSPAQLNPRLARFPRLGHRLSLALQRVFLVWPSIGKREEQLGGPAFDDLDIKNGIVRYAFDFNNTRLTGKQGHEHRAAWCVFMYYSTGASPEAAPEKIIYRGDGLEIIFKLKELSKNE